MARGTRIDGAWAYLLGLREGGKMTLAGLSEKTGIPTGTLSKYESGKLAVPVTAVAGIARGLGLQPERVVARCLLVANPDLAQSDLGTFLADAASE